MYVNDAFLALDAMQAPTVTNGTPQLLSFVQHHVSFSGPPCGSDHGGQPGRLLAVMGLDVLKPRVQHLQRRRRIILQHGCSFAVPKPKSIWKCTLFIFLVFKRNLVFCIRAGTAHTGHPHAPAPPVLLGFEGCPMVSFCFAPRPMPPAAKA